MSKRPCFQASSLGTSQVGGSEVGLEGADRCAELPGGEKPGAEWARDVLADRGKRSQRGADAGRRVVELPAGLVHRHGQHAIP